MNIDNELRVKLLNFYINGKFDGNAYIIYVHLIMYANFKNVNINGVELARGQCLTSTQTLSDKTGLSIQQVKTAIKKLIDFGYIKKYATKKYTIFTICNYDKSKNTTVAKNKQDAKKCEAEDDYPVSQKQSDAERYRYLSEEILKRDLTAEEKEFFNNYNGG